MKIQIRGTGRYLPKKRISSADLEIKLGLDAGTIASRNGVHNRYVADQGAGETTSQMCAWAAEDALRNAQMQKEDLDLIIFASACAEQAVPDTAPFVQDKLGLGASGIACFSVHSTCLSFLTALDVASCLIEMKRYTNVLIVCCELPSTSLNSQDPKTYTLFGDAAAAAVISPSLPGSESQILRTHFSTFGQAAKLTEVRGCGTMYHPNHLDTQFEDNTFHMEGREVLRHSLREAPTALEKIWPGLSTHCDDFDLIVPHQPSLIGMRALSKYFPLEKTMETLSEYGNCVSVSLPLSLDEALRTGRLKPGQRCLLFGTGAGLTIAGMSLII